MKPPDPCRKPPPRENVRTPPSNEWQRSSNASRNSTPPACRNSTMFAMRWRSSGRLLRQVSGLEQRLAELNAARVREAQRDESAAADEVLALRRQLSAEAKAHEKAFNELR